jgi:hypothetical protein
VSPGAVSTAAWADADGFVARLAKDQGVSLAFLASPVNITGSEYLIDGGMIKHV